MEALCINSSGKPEDIPNSKWPIKGLIYTVNHLFKNNGVYACTIEEIDLSDQPIYKHFRLDRFVRLDSNTLNKDLQSLLDKAIQDTDNQQMILLPNKEHERSLDPKSEKIIYDLNSAPFLFSVYDQGFLITYQGPEYFSEKTMFTSIKGVQHKVELSNSIYISITKDSEKFFEVYLKYRDFISQNSTDQIWIHINNQINQRFILNPQIFEIETITPVL